MGAAPPRAATAVSIAARASSASGCSPVGISVMSPTQRLLGADAVKSRLSRSGNLGAVLSCRVSPPRGGSAGR
jgi:hypothetical protein